MTVGACDLLTSVGTAAMLFPVAKLPIRDTGHGANTVQVSPPVTYLDTTATHILVGPRGRSPAAGGG